MAGCSYGSVSKSSLLKSVVSQRPSEHLGTFSSLKPFPAKALTLQQSFGSPLSESAALTTFALRLSSAISSVPWYGILPIADHTGSSPTLQGTRNCGRCTLVSHILFTHPCDIAGAPWVIAVRQPMALGTLILFEWDRTNADNAEPMMKDSATSRAKHHSHQD